METESTAPRQGRMTPEAPLATSQVVPDSALQAQVAARRARREAAEEKEQETRPLDEVLKVAQAGANATEVKLNSEEISGALEHFLATEQDAEAKTEPKSLKLNLGTNDSPQWIRWTIVPVEDTEITKIRKSSQGGTRAQRRRGDTEVDESLVSRRLVVRGTVDPDPGDLAKLLSMSDPADALHAYFSKYGKTGLITQISGEILSISGWDDEDIQEVEVARG